VTLELEDRMVRGDVEVTIEEIAKLEDKAKIEFTTFKKS